MSEPVARSGGTRDAPKPAVGQPTLRRRRKVPVLLILVVLPTVYFFLLNYIYLRMAEKVALPAYELIMASATPDSGELSADVFWSGQPGAGGEYPEIQVGGQALPAHLPLEVQGGGVVSQSVRVVGLDGRASGDFPGTLRVTWRSGSHSESVERSFTVNLNMRNLAQRWWILRGWFVVLAVVYLLLWVACQLLLDPVNGTVTARFSDERELREPLRIRPRWYALFLPWHKNRILLARILCRLGRESTRSFPTIELTFDTLFARPCLEIKPGDETRARFVKTRLGSAARVRSSDGFPLANLELWHRGLCLVLWSPDGHGYVVLQYARDDEDA